MHERPCQRRRERHGETGRAELARVARCTVEDEALLALRRSLEWIGRLVAESAAEEPRSRGRAAAIGVRASLEHDERGRAAEQVGIDGRIQATEMMLHEKILL